MLSSCSVLHKVVCEFKVKDTTEYTERERERERERVRDEKEEEEDK